MRDPPDAAMLLPRPAFFVHAAVAAYLLTLRMVPPEEREGRMTGSTVG